MLERLLDDNSNRDGGVATIPGTPFCERLSKQQGNCSLSSMLPHGLAMRMQGRLQ